MLQKRKSFKKFFYQFSQLIIVIILAFSFILSNFYLPKDSYWYTFFLHITAELVVFFFATFFIERAIENHRKDEEENRWAQAKIYAFSDIKNLVKSLAITLLIALDIDFSLQKESENDKAKILNALSQLTQLSITEVVQKKILPNAKKLSIDLNRDKHDLESTILLYKDIVPPNLLQPIWSLRSQLDRLIYTLIEEENFSSLYESAKPQSIVNEKLVILMTQSIVFALQQYIVKLVDLLEKIE